MNHIEAMKQALEALEEACELIGPAWAWRNEKGKPSITAIKQAFAAPVQEPVAFKHVCNLWIDPVTNEYIVDHCDHPPSECIPAYIGTTPAAPAPEERKRQSAPDPKDRRSAWVGLTDEEIELIFRESSGYGGDDFQSFARAIEAKLKEKNT